MDKNRKEEIIYEERCSFLPLWLIFLLPFAFAIIKIYQKYPLAAGLLSTGVLSVVAVEFIFHYPVRYQLTPTRFIARAGRLLKQEIPLDNIKEIETAGWLSLYLFAGGSKIAGWPKGKIVVINPNRPDRLVITPSPRLLQELLNLTGLNKKR